MADVESLIRRFADDLQALVREQLSSEVTHAVQIALGGKVTRTGKPGGPLKRAKNGKRTPEEIEAQAEKLYAFTALKDTETSFSFDGTYALQRSN